MQQFPHRVVWNPQEAKIIPRYDGQWKQHGDGKVECWYTQEQWDYVIPLCEQLLEEETPANIPPPPRGR